MKPANQLRRACATVLLMCSRDVTRTHTHTQKKDRHLCNGGFYFLSFCDTLVLLEAASHIPEKKKRPPSIPPLSLQHKSDMLLFNTLFFFSQKKKKRNVVWWKSKARGKKTHTKDDVATTIQRERESKEAKMIFKKRKGEIHTLARRVRAEKSEQSGKGEKNNDNKGRQEPQTHLLRR